MSDFTVIDIETTGNEPWRHELVCVGIGGAVHAPERGRTLARMLMARPGTTIVAHTNYDLRWLMLDGATLAEGIQYHDTKVMAWMLDGNQALDLDSLAQKYLDVSPPKLIRMRKKEVHFLCADGEIRPILEAPYDEVADYCLSDVTTEAALYEVLRAALKEEGLWDYFIEEEAPFSRLLVEMEVTGLPFDAEAARLLLLDTEADLERMEAELVEGTGAYGFNPGSSAQVARFLYEEVWEQKVKFPIPRLNGVSPEEKFAAAANIAPEATEVTKVGRDYAYGVQTLDGLGLRTPKVPKWKREQNPDAQPTVSAKILNVMYGDHPWISTYIAWSKKAKLAGYLRSWIDKEHNGRLHGRFDQSGTITGRLSGKKPNLQQVDNSVRDLFRGDLVVGDYAGLEARLAAHFSGDPVMLDIFRNGKDLYGTLASRAWGGPEDKDNPGRALFKIVWLGSQYGAQGETLAMTMAVGGMRGYTARKADALLRDLHDTCPDLFAWRDEVIEDAKYRGYVTTLAGRKRRLPDITSSVWRVMAGAERQAVNSKVQGSAADVVRRAMLAARRAVPPNVARICLQVHDEILWERGPDWDDDVFNTLVSTCEEGFGFELDVPLTFEAKIAQSWADKGAAPGGIDLNEALEVAVA